MRISGFSSGGCSSDLDEIIQESVDEYFDECQHYAPPCVAMRQEMRISCFSSEADNLLMWSHYGDGLRGFCIAFDEEAITRGDTTGYVLDVAYLDAARKSTRLNSSH